MSQSLQCNLCRHFWGLGCDAFGERIPAAIRTGFFDHRQPFPGDHGIRWEPASEEAAQLAAALDADDDEGEGDTSA